MGLDFFHGLLCPTSLRSPVFFSDIFFFLFFLLLLLPSPTFSARRIEGEIFSPSPCINPGVVEPLAPVVVTTSQAAVVVEPVVEAAPVSVAELTALVVGGGAPLDAASTAVSVTAAV